VARPKEKKKAIGKMIMGKMIKNPNQIFSHHFADHHFAQSLLFLCPEAGFGLSCVQIPL
jgi:hypothetical protein